MKSWERKMDINVCLLGFQGKAKSMKLLIVLGVAFAAILLVSFDRRQGNDIRDFRAINIPAGAIGPESFAFDGSGRGPYTGVSDGRILRHLANESRWVDFAITTTHRTGCEGPHDHSSREHICGRPLGMCFNEKTGQLYIGDAYMGLLVVGPNGGLAIPVSGEATKLGLGFTNSLDIDQNTGVVYFTDSSSRFRRRNYVSVIISGDATGRLLKFDPQTQTTTVLLDNLKFPNGVALSKNGDFLLFVETTTCKLFKFWLTPSNYGTVEFLAELPGFPDNIKRTRNGEFWVGINSIRGKLLEWLISKPWIGSAFLRISPLDVTTAHSILARISGSSGLGVKLDKAGRVAAVLDFERRWKFVSEVAEEETGDLWIGSVKMPFAGREKRVGDGDKDNGVGISIS